MTNETVCLSVEADYPRTGYTDTLFCCVTIGPQPRSAPPLLQVRPFVRHPRSATLLNMIVYHIVYITHSAAARIHVLRIAKLLRHTDTLFARDVVSVLNVSVSSRS